MGTRPTLITPTAAEASRRGNRNYSGGRRQQLPPGPTPVSTVSLHCYARWVATIPAARLIGHSATRIDDTSLSRFEASRRLPPPLRGGGRATAPTAPRLSGTPTAPTARTALRLSGSPTAQSFVTNYCTAALWLAYCTVICH